MINKMTKKVNFDICTFCNHSCMFCSNSDKRTKKAVTRFEDFVKTMDNVCKYVNIKELGLSAKGEVLLNKDLEKIVKYCKDILKIPYIYISSNGALLDKKRALSLLESGLDSIKFSINALDKYAYNIVHKKDDFEKVMENLKNLILLKKTKFSSLKIFISSVLTANNVQNPREVFSSIFKEDMQYINDIWHYKEEIPQKDYIDSSSNIKEILTEKKLNRGGAAA